MIFNYLGTVTGKGCSQIFGYAIFRHKEEEFAGPLCINWVKEEYILYPPGENGGLMTHCEAEQLLGNKAKPKRNWLKCTLVRMLHEAGKFGYINIRFL